MKTNPINPQQWGIQVPGPNDMSRGVKPTNTASTEANEMNGATLHPGKLIVAEVPILVSFAATALTT